MYLSRQQMQDTVHNVLDTRFDENGLMCFSRFTEEQIADYGLDGEAFPVRCIASANVTLEFVTDSDWLGIEFEAGRGSSQPFYTLDLLVDGTLYDYRRKEDFGRIGVLFDLPEGTHTVCVFLPWSASLKVVSMAVQDNAVIRAVPEKKRRIITLGDSITQGYIAVHPSNTWVGKMTRDLNAEVLNLGVGGYGFYTNSLNHPITWPADLVIEAYGTNDYSRDNTKATYRLCAQQYFSRLESLFPDTPILVILPLYRNEEKNRFRERTRDYTLEDARQLLRDIAAGYSNMHIMETAYFPHPLDFFAPDWLHPNDQGFLVHGERVVKEVRALLEHR